MTTGRYPSMRTKVRKKCVTVGGHTNRSSNEGKGGSRTVFLTLDNKRSFDKLTESLVIERSFMGYKENLHVLVVIYPMYVNIIILIKIHFE